MLKYSKILMNSIEREKKGLDYFYPEVDKKLLHKLLKEINIYAGTNFHYLAELVAFNIPGSGNIMEKYITNFSSESVKGYLIPQMVSDKIKDCDKLVLQLYRHFKQSEFYISKPGAPAPAHIYVRYDDAFRRLRPRRIKNELAALAFYPRDAYYLPFTMRMLASWKMPGFYDLLLSYLDGTCITAQSVGISDENERLFPPLEAIKRELKFTAIAGLKYYPSAEVTDIITSLAISADKDIQSAAKRTLKALTK